MKNKNTKTRKMLIEGLDTSALNSLKVLMFIDLGAYLDNQAGSMVVMLPDVGAKQMMKWMRFMNDNELYTSNKSQLEALYTRFSGNDVLNDIYSSINKLKSSTVDTAEDSEARNKKIFSELGRAARYVSSKLTDPERELFSQVSPDLKSPTLLAIKSMNDQLQFTYKEPEENPEEMPDDDAASNDTEPEVDTDSADDSTTDTGGDDGNSDKVDSEENSDAPKQDAPDSSNEPADDNPTDDTADTEDGGDSKENKEDVKTNEGYIRGVRPNIAKFINAVNEHRVDGQEYRCIVELAKLVGSKKHLSALLNLQEMNKSVGIPKNNIALIRRTMVMEMLKQLKTTLNMKEFSIVHKLYIKIGDYILNTRNF